MGGGGDCGTEDTCASGVSAWWWGVGRGSGAAGRALVFLPWSVCCICHKALFESMERDQIKRGVLKTKETENA